MLHSLKLLVRSKQVVGDAVKDSVRKKAKLRDQYNQVTHLNQVTIWEIKHHIPESQAVSPLPAGDHKAAGNREHSMTQANTKHK